MNDTDMRKLNGVEIAEVAAYLESHRKTKVCDVAEHFTQKWGGLPVTATAVAQCMLLLAAREQNRPCGRY